MISRHRVHSNGRTAYEAIRGKRCNVPVCGFAEKVMFRKAPTAKDCNWKPGICVGNVRISDESVVVNEQGRSPNPEN